MKRYLLTKSAKADLDEIWFFLARRSGNVIPAEHVIHQLEETIVSLAVHPGIGRRCADIDEDGRCFPVGNYIIYYREEARRIAITHVFHAKRDQARAWKQAPKGR